MFLETMIDEGSPTYSAQATVPAIILQSVTL
jgi:hypothetical protein